MSLTRVGQEMKSCSFVSVNQVAYFLGVFPGLLHRVWVGVKVEEKIEK